MRVSRTALRIGITVFAALGLASAFTLHFRHSTVASHSNVLARSPLEPIYFLVPLPAKLPALPAAPIAASKLSPADATKVPLPTTKSDSKTALEASRITVLALGEGDAYAMKTARHLRQEVERGRIVLWNGERDGEQLREIERCGHYSWPPSPEDVAAHTALASAVQGELPTGEACIETGAASNAGIAKPAEATARRSPAASKSPDSLSHSEPTSAKSALPLAMNAKSRNAEQTGKTQAATPMERSESESASVGTREAEGTAAKKAKNGKKSSGVPADSVVSSTSESGTVPARPSLPPLVSPTIQPAPALLHLLDCLAAHSSSRAPLEILSLLRPPYRTDYWRHAGPRNPHSNGQAVDVLGYAGHRVIQSDPEACVAVTLAILRDLPPGRYRIGMPKAPEPPRPTKPNGWPTPLADTLAALRPKAATNAEVVRGSLAFRRKQQAAREEKETSPVADSLANLGCLGASEGLFLGGATVSSTPAWPFFPAPEVVSKDDAEVAAGTIRFQNEAYAPEACLADPRLREALQAARRRGADVYALFPDAADHVHVDVR